MLIKDVELGKVYIMRHHAGNLIRVKLLFEKTRNCYGSYPGQWNTVVSKRTHYKAINLETGREIEVKSAAKLWREYDVEKDFEYFARKS
jgi:hypothetical protein